MKLWLDDMRKPPWGYDLWAKTADEAIEMLQRHKDAIEHCSLDHDLADEHYLDPSVTSYTSYSSPPSVIDREKYKEKTGFYVLEWMKEQNQWVKHIHVHTLNPVGRENMVNFIKRHAPSEVVWAIMPAFSC
jgi:hypothetical protein